MAKAADRKKLMTLRERFAKAIEADQENRRLCQEDLKFLHVPGEQWEQPTILERGDRPRYEFNKLRVTIKRVVNDMRANRPAGKVRGQEEGDKDTAEVIEGLIRNIWTCSDGDTVIDQAAEYQVGGGMGAWRIRVDYADDSAFEQDITIEAIQNPLCLYADPAAVDPLKRDARYWFVTSRMAKEAYEAKYPKAENVDFEDGTEFDDAADWDDGETVRICEYWYQEPVERMILLLSNGKTITEDELTPELTQLLMAQGVSVLRSRKSQSHQIKMCIASGDAILEEADWAGREFPFVLVYGESLVIDGKHRWFGLTRFAKDAQRSYNYSRTLAIESVATATQSKYWATPNQAQGHLEKWAEAHKKNYPVQLYNADPQAPGPPQRMGGADVPVALISEMQISSDDIKAVTGIFDASLGNKSNETSGVAIRSRQAQSEIATYNYMDNLSKGIRRTWEILIDLIPRYYDTARVVRILGVDGSEKYAQINQPGPNGEVVNDLSRGKYDVMVTTGPSFSTQRAEAAEMYGQMLQGNPQLFPVIGDLVFKATDLPYSNEIAERMRKMLPPQLQDAPDGKPMPPEVQQAMMQADQAMQQVQMMGQQLQQASQEVDQGKLDVERGKSEIKGMIADLKVQQAELKTAEAELKAMIAEAEANLAQREVALAQTVKDAQTEGQGYVAQAERAGEATAVQIVQEALAAVGERIGELEDKLSELKQQPPIVIPVGGGQRSISLVRDASGRLAGAQVEG